jgi:drug/metabolite transporter (DMT)-like permease
LLFRPNRYNPRNAKIFEDFCKFLRRNLRGAMTNQRATAIGFTAVLMWSLLALFTIGSAPVPPFLLNALTFGIGGTLGLIWTLRNGLDRLRGIPWRVYAFGIIGLFGYHALYFTAFRIAPAAETGLMAYLWPLFIVLFASFLPGERLRPMAIIGALVAFAGAALIVMGRDAGGNATALGLILGFLCAITWAGYSTLSRRLGDIPTETVTIYCLGTALLSALVHPLVEDTVWPTTPQGWLSIVALGIGPVGAAFFTWDIGMKKGDIQLLGVASYAAPLLSTLALVLAGITPASWTILAAAILITAGAALAARASAKG